jgi:hypothetical protein
MVAVTSKGAIILTDWIFDIYWKRFFIWEE